MPSIQLRPWPITRDDEMVFMSNSDDELSMECLSCEKAQRPNVIRKQGEFYHKCRGCDLEVKVNRDGSFEELVASVGVIENSLGNVITDEEIERIRTGYQALAKTSAEAIRGPHPSRDFHPPSLWTAIFAGMALVYGVGATPPDGEIIVLLFSFIVASLLRDLGVWFQTK